MRTAPVAIVVFVVTGWAFALLAGACLSAQQRLPQKPQGALVTRAMRRVVTTVLRLERLIVGTGRPELLAEQVESSVAVRHAGVVSAAALALEIWFTFEGFAAVVDVDHPRSPPENVCCCCCHRLADRHHRRHWLSCCRCP